METVGAMVKTTTKHVSLMVVTAVQVHGMIFGPIWTCKHLILLYVQNVSAFNEVIVKKKKFLNFSEKNYYIFYPFLGEYASDMIE